MNLLLNGSAVQVPLSFSAEWVSVNGVLLRQVTLRYGTISPAAAALVLGPSMSSGGVNVTFLDPSTNANATLLLHCYSAEVTALYERSSVLYSPLILILRALPPDP